MLSIEQKDPLDAKVLDRSTPLNPADWGTKPVNYREPFYNPHDAYACPAGHIEYNRTEEHLADIRSRGVQLPRQVHEGMACLQCGGYLTKLDDDPAKLQSTLSGYMKMATRLKENEPGLLETNRDYNDISLFMRLNYQYEIEQGEAQHAKKLSDAVKFYLHRERRRPSVVAARIWRALLRALGV